MSKKVIFMCLLASSMVFSAPSINEAEVEKMVQDILSKSQTDERKLSRDEIAEITNIVKSKLEAKATKEKLEVVKKPQKVQTVSKEDVAKKSGELELSLLTSPENKSMNSSVDTFNKVVLKNVSKETLTDKIRKVAEAKSDKDASTFVKSLSKEAKVRDQEMRFVVVKKGDTLSKIAQGVYGSIRHYRKIYKANDDVVRNPNKIYIGQKLRVPEL